MSVIAFIGGGNMSSSIIGGLVASGYDADKIIVSDRNADKCEKLAKQYQIRIAQNNQQAVEQSDYIVLSVKPQAMKEMLAPIQNAFTSNNKVIISVAAGITCDSINKWLGAQYPIIRVMPNTPCLVGQGTSGLYANQYCHSAHCETATQIMQAVGVVIWVEDEKQIDTVTGISGSGPAYFYQLMEFMQKSAVKNGLNEQDARKIVVQTALGAATLAGQSDQTLQQLKQNVCSPGGTTEAAINHMQADDIENITVNGIDAAISRAAELATILAND